MLKIMMNLKNYKVYYEPFPHLIFEDVFNEKFYIQQKKILYSFRIL